MKARLEAERGRIEAEIDALGRDFDNVVADVEHNPPDDEHDPSGATIGFERAQLRALIDMLRQRRAELDAAIARFDAGTYGTCDRCGGAIGDERLDAQPSATTCIRCAVPRRARSLRR